MTQPQNVSLFSTPSDENGRFTWPGLLLAMLVSPAVGLIYAWIGAMVQPYFAPLVLFPLLIGVFIGLTIIGLVRFGQVGNRPTIFLAVLLAALVAAGGHHYFTWAAYHGAGPVVSPTTGRDLSAIRRELTPSFSQYLCAQARRGRPLVGPYVAYGWAAWLTWTIDLLLVAAAAVAVTIPAVRVPYCNRCGSWYRTIRSGRLDAPTAERLAELFGVEEIDSLRSPRYRLSNCQSGCGPMRCELSWEDARGAVALVRVWLDAAARNQVSTILDGLGTTDANNE